MHKSSMPRTPYAWLHSLAGLCGLCGHSKLLKMNSFSHLLVPEFPQMTVLNLVLGGTIFTEGGHYWLVNNVLGGQYSLVNNVRGDIFGGTLYTMTTVPVTQYNAHKYAFLPTLKSSPWTMNPYEPLHDPVYRSTLVVQWFEVVLPSPLSPNEGISILGGMKGSLTSKLMGFRDRKLKDGKQITYSIAPFTRTNPGYFNPD